MTSKEYMQQAKRAQSRIVWNLPPAVLQALFGIVSESGALVDEFKRHSFEGTPLNRANVEEQLGDILHYTALLCNFYDCDFESVMAKNIAKLKAQYPEQFSDQQPVNKELSPKSTSMRIEVADQPHPEQH